MSDMPAPEQILLVDDDDRLRTLVGEVLQANGYAVVSVPSAADALEMLQREPVDLVVTDIKMPGMTGDQLLAEVRATFPEVPVIGVTAFGTPEDAAALTRAGAADYLTKPFRTPVLLGAVERVLRETRPPREAARERRERGAHLDGLVGRSAAMQPLLGRIGRVAASGAPVLITGETGTGKEVVAQAVHRASGRGPFVPINCSAIPANLLESELFGHVRGAFTGADHDKAGLFERADGGTLFLDEIAEMPLALQPRLLRVLQFGELRRIGELQHRSVDVRIVAATHRDLPERVRSGQFREDLFFRINVLRLDVPPLRDRLDDIPSLAEHFLAEAAARDARSAARISPEALGALLLHSWPGNVRELANVVERASIFADGSEIRLDDLPEEIRGPLPAAARVPPLHLAAQQGLTLEALERAYILEVLRRSGGNRSRAAELLGLPRRTLYRRLTEYGVLGEE